MSKYYEIQGTPESTPEDVTKPEGVPQARLPVESGERFTASQEDYTVNVSYTRQGSAVGWTIAVSVVSNKSKNPINYGEVILNGQAIYRAAPGAHGFTFSRHGLGTYPGINKLEVHVESFKWPYEWE